MIDQPPNDPVKTGGDKPNPDDSAAGQPVTGETSSAALNNAAGVGPGDRPKKPATASPSTKQPRKTSPSRATKFAPQDLTDGREPLDWKTKYDDPVAKKGIRFEACY